MKKFLSILLFVLTISNGYSQEYKKFKVELGFGATSYKGAHSELFVEPAYRISDNVAVSLKYEDVFIINGTGNPVVTKSLSLNGQYYFSKTKVRPFVGAGVGYNHLGAGGAGSDGYITFETSKVGFTPRIGFDFNHLTMSIEYNWMTPTKNIYYAIYPMMNLTPPPTVSYINTNYFSAKVGVTIGGGKKKPKQTE